MFIYLSVWSKLDWKINTVYTYITMITYGYNNDRSVFPK